MFHMNRYELLAFLLILSLALSGGWIGHHYGTAAMIAGFFAGGMFLPLVMMVALKIMDARK